ncbi:MAG: hypothetical protein JSS20_12730 [Proteobacteria bacterium]|nr:hypothetical protein [Pseudomonadota bacterium]
MRSVVFLFLLFPLVAAFAAHASSQTPQTPAALANTAASCGATVAEGMQRVNAALAATDPASQRIALICLTQIVAAMNNEMTVLDGKVFGATVPVPASSIKVNRQ